MDLSLLAQLQLSEADYVARFRELMKLGEVARLYDEPMPLDMWVPSTTGSFVTLTEPFRRSTRGWEIVTVAGSFGCDLIFSFDRSLPRGYSVTRIRLEYQANELVPANAMSLQLVRYNRSTGSNTFQQSISLPQSPVVGATQMTATLTPVQPVQAVSGFENFALIRRLGSNDVGGQFRAKTLYLDYSYLRLGAR